MLSNLLFSIDHQVTGILPGTSDFPAFPAIDDTNALLQTHANTAVIVVEDDDALREIICVRLRGSGYQVFGTATAGEAHALLAEHKSQPLILVTDLVLHGDGGWSLATWAREQIPDLPIVFMSGFIDETVIRPALEHGHATFLQKPFTLQNLIERLEAVSTK